MRVVETSFPDVLVVEPKVLGDSRGFFMETYSRDRYVEAGIPATFVQDNLSRSSHGTLRGMHLQHPFGQGKLCFVLEGEVCDVVVDVRVGSPTFKKWEAFVLSSENKRQLYVPPGFAHGFCVTGDTALFSYKCTDLYHAETELGVAWNDPDVGIHWPIGNPSLSDKDRANPFLRDIPEERLPGYG